MSEEELRRLLKKNHFCRGIKHVKGYRRGDEITEKERNRAGCGAW
ncbi:hypothetical protein [Vulcanisaeta sp. JCM 14467]|nr:hypothetical protein [Vulcanisaeta sp. JCM 14467]